MEVGLASSLVVLSLRCFLGFRITVVNLLGVFFNLVGGFDCLFFVNVHVNVGILVMFLVSGWDVSWFGWSSAGATQYHLILSKVVRNRD